MKNHPASVHEDHPSNAIVPGIGKAELNKVAQDIKEDGLKASTHEDHPLIGKAEVNTLAQDIREYGLTDTLANYAEALPPLSTEDFEMLRISIEHEGVIVPAITDGKGNIIDGKNRKKLDLDSLELICRSVERM